MDTVVFSVLIFNISLDAFIMMMEKGATILKLDIKKALTHSLIFSVVNTCLFLIGHFVASQIFTEQWIEINRALLIIIFLAIGLRILLRTLNKAPFEEKLDIHFNNIESIKKAMLSGIDCLLIGFGCYYIDISIVYQNLIVFFVTFFVVCSALYTGYCQGAAYQKGLYYFCGIVYIVLAMLMILRLL